MFDHAKIHWTYGSRILRLEDMNFLPLRNRVNTLRDELRERREAHAAYVTLRRELASFQTAREVDDLLGVIAHQEGPEAQQIRDILMDNLRPTAGQRRAA